MNMWHCGFLYSAALSYIILFQNPEKKMDQNSLAQLDPVSQDDRTKEEEHSSLSPPDPEVFSSNIYIY